MPFARRVRGQRRGVDVLVEVDRPDHQRALRRIGDERGGRRRGLGPSVEVLRGGAAPRDAELEAAPVEQPLDLVGQQEERGQRGRVVGLVLARVLERGRRARGTAGCQRPSAPSSSSIRAIARRAQDRQPEAAVRGEGLLRGEVVGVGLRDVDGQSARARGGVDQDEAVARAVGPLHGHHHAGRGLVVGPGDRVRPRIGGRRRGIAGLGLDQDRVGQKGGAGGRLGELRGELAVGEMQRSLADQAAGGRVPERGRAAVAQRDLVAVGQAEELAEPGPHAGDEILHRSLPVRGSHQVVLARQLGQGLRPDLRRAAAESPVLGLQRSGDLNDCSCHRRTAEGNHPNCWTALRRVG